MLFKVGGKLVKGLCKTVAAELDAPDEIKAIVDVVGDLAEVAGDNAKFLDPFEASTELLAGEDLIDRLMEELE